MKTIYSSETASDWLKSTFFFTRFRTNPSAYQVDGLNYASDIDMDTLIRQFCDKKMKELLEAKIIDLVDRKYISTIYGEAMSRYYISFQTMNSIIQLKNALSIGDLVSVIVMNITYCGSYYDHEMLCDINSCKNIVAQYW